MDNIVKDYKKSNPDLFHIGILHTNVDGQANHDPYCPSRLHELISGEMDYWALGHIHKSSILHNKPPYIVYPGNSQGRHILETGDKGCYYVEVEEHQVHMMEWLPTANIRWETLELDISSIDSIPDVVSMIEAAIEEKLTQLDLPTIYRINLKGRTPLHTLLLEEYQRVEMIEVLNDYLSNQQPWGLVETIKIRTQPFISKETILEQGTFLADYINQFDQFFSVIEVEHIQKEVLADLFRHRGMKKHFTTLTDEEIEELKGQVLNYAFDYLVEKD
ncbi:hypothetical protein [Tepidibacillus marianensis]|uniref:metallophosphoesterase family protein n=1 Tax=Tepidibacillus marianensis TaxID=3131995 RepID=UPI0030D3620D